MFLKYELLRFEYRTKCVFLSDRTAEKQLTLSSVKRVCQKDPSSRSAAVLGRVEQSPAIERVDLVRDI